MRNIGVIDDDLIPMVDLKIVRPNFDPIDIPKKLGGVLAFHLGQSHHERIKA